MSAAKNGLYTLLIAGASLLPAFSFAQAGPNTGGDPKTEKTTKKWEAGNDKDLQAQDASKGGKLAFVAYLDAKSRGMTDERVKEVLKTKYLSGLKQDCEIFVDRETNNGSTGLVRAFSNGYLKYPSFISLNQLKSQVENINSGVFVDLNKPSENTVSLVQ